MIKNKLATVLGVPAGATWLIDNFVTNMPHVLEGGVFVAGVAASLLGWSGVRRVLNAATSDSDSAPSPVVEAEVVQEQAAPAQATVHQLPSAERVQEALQAAFLMGAEAAKDRRSVER